MTVSKVKHGRILQVCLTKLLPMAVRTGGAAVGRMGVGGAGGVTRLGRVTRGMVTVGVGLLVLMVWLVVL